MEPNYNFDQNNTTEPCTNEPRVITIKQSELGALRNQGYNRTTIAKYYGITPQELYQVMVGFNMVKQRTEKENLPSYVINPVNDLPILDTVVEETAEITA